MKNKELFSKSINKEILVDKVETKKDDKGNDVKITTQEKAKVPVKVIVVNPSRVLREMCELYYASTISDLVNRNISTRHSLRQKLFGPLVAKTEKLEMEFAQLSKTEEKDLSENDKKRLEIVKEELTACLQELLSAQDNNEVLFSQTAEAIADTKLLTFYTLHLSYLQEDNKEPQALFYGETFEQKLKDFDEKEEKLEPFYVEARNLVSTIVSLWIRGYAGNQKEFDEALKKLEEANKPKVEDKK